MIHSQTDVPLTQAEKGHISVDASACVCPELLAPAGSPDSFRAAIANGADAVYLGLGAFNARRSAENFTLEELPELCRYAHISGVKVYLTANVVILPREINEVLAMIADAWNAGVDAVIIQDIGLMDAVHTHYPEVRIHASTQMGAHDSETINAIAQLGASRVTLAREVSLEEIRDFSKLGVEIESFGHGALCMCYSGQCLMSSLIGQRSANRGMCAQPCRLTYELLDERHETIETPGGYLLSPKDLCSIERLPDLIDAGVAAIKIEGRMKSAAYVAVVVGAYRRALDRAWEDSTGFSVDDTEKSMLAEVFSRGFTEAYLVGDRSNEMMGYTRPNNRGVQIGRIHSIQNGIVTLAVEKPLAAGDIVEFWTGRGRFAQPVGRMLLDGAQIDLAPAGSKVQIDVTKAISPGDRVFRVENSLLSAEALATYAGSKGRTMHLSAHATLQKGEPLKLTLVNKAGLVGSAEGPVVEAARTKAVSEEEVCEHIGRLGNTPYEIEAWDIDLENDVGIGFSALHKVRRDAIEDLERQVVQPWEDRKQINACAMEFDQRPKQRDAIELAIIVDNEDAARRCLSAGADRVIVDSEAIFEERFDLSVTTLLPRVCHDDDMPEVLSTLDEDRDAIATTLGLLSLSQQRAKHVEAGWSFNITNPLTASALEKRGASSGILSPELTQHQLGEVCAHTDLRMGLVVFGLQEMMVTEHCVLMAEGPCNQNCLGCRRRAKMHSLKDRKGYLFPLRTDFLGRTHIYNAVPLDLIPSMAEVVATGVSQVIVDATLLKPHQAVEQLERARTALSSVLAGVDVPDVRYPESTTAGHFRRGVN